MKRLLLSLLPVLTALSCYSAGGDGDEGAGASAGDSYGGSLPRGGSVGNGGSSGKGGSSGRGGSAGDGGIAGSIAGSAGNAGSAGMASCGDVADCGTSTTGAFYECVPPGAAPVQSDLCGAIDWCGQCSCGPQPQQPYGTGTLCDEVTPCPTAETTPGFETYASVCDLNGQCTACAVDEDCSIEAPRCATGRTGFGNECFECIENIDCPEALPVCVPMEAAFQSYTPGGVCRECATQTDCATGICVEGACQPQCAVAEDCNNAFLTCGPELRCVAAPCSTAAECAEFGACLDGGCVRMSCTSDTECSGGACVNGACYSGAGSCVEHFAYP